MNGNGKQSINFQRNSLISHGPLSSIDSLVTMNALPADEIDEKSRRGKEKVESPWNRMQTVDRGDESILSDLSNWLVAKARHCIQFLLGIRLNRENSGVVRFSSDKLPVCR